MQTNNTMLYDACQVLDDITSSGRSKPWREFRLVANTIADVYKRNGDLGRYLRMAECADKLGFVASSDGHLILDSAQFCRIRMCPICQWRRSLKLQAQIHKIVDALEPGKYAMLLLTLTVRNVYASDLSRTLTRMLQGYNRLVKYKEVDRMLQGYVRTVEVTYRHFDAGETASGLVGHTYHPHIHALLLVNKSYFTSRDYIRQSRWTELWARACKLDYTPQVDIRKVDTSGTDDLWQSICEVTKYTVKPTDIAQIIADDDQFTLVAGALSHRRFCGLGGKIKELHKQLNLEDLDDDDLGDGIYLDKVTGEVYTEEDKLYYIWHAGLQNYVKSIEDTEE